MQQGVLQAAFQVLHAAISSAPGGIPILTAFQVLKAVFQVGGAPGGIAAGGIPCYEIPVPDGLPGKQGLDKEEPLEF